MQESKAPYGSVVAALATLMKSYEGSEQADIEEEIVLNERPYEWYVYQQDTGEYSQMNCMPSTVEMALRYQGLSDVPSAETLQKFALLKQMQKPCFSIFLRIAVSSNWNMHHEIYGGR